MDGTPFEPPDERLFPSVPPEYKRITRGPRKAWPGIVNRPLQIPVVIPENQGEAEKLDDSEQYESQYKQGDSADDRTHWSNETQTPD